MGSYRKSEPERGAQMRVGKRGIFAAAWPLTVVVAITIAALLIPRPSAAAPVQYVKVCDSLGAGYEYRIYAYNCPRSVSTFQLNLLYPFGL